MNNNNRKDIIFFLLVCFGWSWFFWIVEIVAGIKLYAGPWGPLVAAFAVKWRREGKSGILGLLSSAVIYKGTKKWLFPVLLIMPVAAGLSYLLTGMAGEEIPISKAFSRPWIILTNFIYILFLGGPLQEEFGWRGFLLPALQKKYNALSSSVLLGIIWAIWHFPLNFTPDNAGPQYIAAVQMLAGSVIMMILLSVIFTWIYNNTEGSILMALLLHTMLNLSAYVIFPVFETKTGPGLFMLILLILSVTILIFYGKNHLVRTKIYHTK